MPDEPAAPTATTDAGLEDLERRLAAFETATKRLNRTVAKGPAPAPAPAAETGHGSPPARPATRRFSDSGRLPHEEISGLRPAVASQGPQTGALTARPREATASPGFTSKFGKPAIPAATPAPAAAPAPAPAPAAAPHPLRPLWRWVALGAGLATLASIAALPRMFPTLTDGLVWAERRAVAAQASGTVDRVLVRVGEQVEAGQPLLSIGGSSLSAPSAGTISRLLVNAGQRPALGEQVAEISIPPIRVVVTLPPSMEPQKGDRARIELVGEQRWIDGSVESVLPVGAVGPGSPALRRAVILPALSPLPLQLNQGAQVMLLGPPTAGRMLLASLRAMLPW